MRIIVSVLLGLIAVAAGAVWALGQFGGSGGVTIATAEPYVREAGVVAADGTVTPAPINSPSARNLPDAPAAPETPGEQPAEPQANPSASAISPFSTLNGGGAPPNQPVQPPTADVPPASAPAEAEMRVAPQNAPAAATASAASLESQYKSRRLTYNRPPAKLALDRAIDISLLIDTARQTDAVDRLKGLPGTIEERDVDLSDTVSAELLGAAFDIQLQTTSTRQKLSSKLANEWRWRVTPKQKGTHTLTLNVYGYAVASLDAEPLDSYRDEITIEVEPVDELVGWARGVQPLFAVLAALAGVGSAIFAFLRFREEKKQTGALTKKSD
ncbi:MAG: hypothetical protein B7Z38_01190 [Rhodobacterales bacterium 12-64-8]|nr:MAG: hypothetical protein B7Z38_01190 [Rhodobacterales bacterium 12-64-8]OYX48983.1 MAG: hypothetical protein B7Y90_08630 [Alphaproteobacteria bacterium 32-64-14]